MGVTVSVDTVSFWGVQSATKSDGGNGCPTL